MAADKPLALVIEDDPPSAEALTMVLRDWGADVVQGKDADTVAAAQPRHQDLRWIITDFNLGPGPDGVTLVNRLKRSAPNARVLVLSGTFDGHSLAAANAAGYEVMHKPARADAIVAWLERG